MTIKGGQKGGQKEPAHRINEAITAQEVRCKVLITKLLVLFHLTKRWTKLKKQVLILVEISPTAKPPVCRVMDYGKFLYEKSKQQKEQRKKQKQIQVKEIKFRPGTDEGDYQVKLRNLKRFLEGGDKAKVTVRFRGREMAHQEIGIELLNRVKGDLEDIASVEFFPKKAEGRQMIMVLAPIKR